MPTSKNAFPSVHWSMRNILFSIGGNNGWHLRQVEEYSILKNKWRFHSQLPRTIVASSGVVLKGVLYNIGGMKSSHPILGCDLSSTHQPKWMALDFREARFKWYWYRSAFLLGKEIVYFGTCDVKTAFVFSKEKGSHQLKVERRDPDINFSYATFESTSKCFKNAIYAF